jgi:tetratricopeptide (TPR) repeat protein
MSVPEGAELPSHEDASVVAPTPWAGELARVDEGIARATGRWEPHKNDWSRAVPLVGLLRQRARLRGGLDDVMRAEAVLAEAFTVAPAGSGPVLARAGLNLSLHRLPAAQVDLDAMAARPFRTGPQGASLVALQATLALQRGELAAAEAMWRAREAAAPSQQAAVGLAQVAWARGHYAEADQWFATSAERYHGDALEPVAWAHLQRGLLDLDRGLPAEALAHYRLADTAMGGFWLVEEHIAEALALLGQVDEAEVLYRDVVARTQNPELQSSLAALLEEAGHREEAADLVAAATATFALHRTQVPEAATGHALEHALRWGTDPAEALAMAEANAALRPNGEALALLSEARLAAGDATGASEATALALATGARSPALYVAAAAASEALGEPEEAAGYRAAAVALIAYQPPSTP